MQADKIVSYFVTLICFYISARTAFAFFGSKPRLFSAASMFALSWAVLLPYYGSDITSEMLPAFNGFLLGYVGALLNEEARARAGEASRVDHPMKVILWLLFFLLAPGLVAFGIELDVPIKIANWNAYKTELVVNLVITAIGYFILAQGLWRFAHSHAPPNPQGYWWAAVTVLVAYFCVSLYFDWLVFTGADLPAASSGNFWSEPSRPPMTTEFRYVFAIAKTALTVLFIQVLVWTDTPAERRNSETAFDYMITILKFWKQGEVD